MREYQWFVEPKDPHTNEVISEMSDEAGEQICEDKEYHNLWRCDRKTINLLKKGKKKFNLDFRIFVQEGKGKIRKWKF